MRPVLILLKGANPIEMKKNLNEAWAEFVRMYEADKINPNCLDDGKFEFEQCDFQYLADLFDNQGSA